MFICEQRKGYHIDRVGFASVKKADSWLNDKVNYWRTVQRQGQLNEDVHLEVVTTINENIEVLAKHDIARNMSPKYVSALKLNMWDLKALRSCVGLMKLMLNKEMGIVNEENCNRLIETIDKALENYEN